MPDLEASVEQYRKFITQRLLPLEAELLSKPFRQLLPTLQDLRNAAKAEGLWTPHLPVALGGAGLTLEEFGHLSREMGRSPIGHYIFNSQAPDIGNQELLMHFGTVSQKEQYLKPLIAGSIRSCFGMTEPEFAGSNPVRLGTIAWREGNNYIIKGHKWFTTAADGAAFCIVMAMTNPEAPEPHKRASMIIVPTDTPGFTRVRNIPVMGDTGEDYMSHAEIKLENCKVPVSNRIGDEGLGFALAQHRLGPGRIHHCMRWIGIAERALEMTCRHATQRELREGESLSDQQSLQHVIAESYAELRASELLVLNTARSIDLHGTHAAKDDISLIKFYVAGMLQRMLDRAIQAHGALGITDDTLLSYWYRHERGARIYDGPDEVHKGVVARAVFKRFTAS